MRRIYLLSIVLLEALNGINAQKSTELDFKTPMPPESYQFKKRLVNNVSLYTGQPSISIPLYTINLDGLEIPISISYNTGGIKTDEEATFLGLGWSLNIGGEISRTNHGAPDENYLMTTLYNQPNAGIGSLKTPSVTGFTGNYVDFCSGNVFAQMIPYANFYKNAYYSSDPLSSYESFDARPDEFYYNMPEGHSGKLMYSQKKSKFISIPYDDIKTEYVLSNTQYGSYIKKNLDFNFTLSNGYKIFFGRGGVKSMFKLMTGGKLFDQAWQIENITSPKGNSIHYSYQPIEYQLCKNIQTVTSRIQATGEVSSETINCNEVTNKDNLPSTITFPQGKIVFFYNNRTDLMPGSKRLEKMVIYNSSGLINKTVEFTQSYFEANYDIYSNNNYPIYNDIVNKRLKLNSIKISNGINTSVNSNEVYSFDYNLFDKVPTKNTTRDHWGYFNGGAFNGLIFPKTKNIHSTYSQTFSLKKIKFPREGLKNLFMRIMMRSLMKELKGIMKTLQMTVLKLKNKVLMLVDTIF